jgi:hypothetical protein
MPVRRLTRRRYCRRVRRIDLYPVVLQCNVLLSLSLITGHVVRLAMTAADINMMRDIGHMRNESRLDNRRDGPRSSKTSIMNPMDPLLLRTRRRF